MTIPTWRHLVPILTVTALQGCTVPDGYREPRCHAEPDFRIATQGAGPEDLVVTALNEGTSQQYIFAREVEGGWAGLFSRCDTDDCRIGRIDIGPESEDRKTASAWRPDADEFHPLGMSLIQRTGDDALYLIDAGSPVKLWKLLIKDGEVQDAQTVFKDAEDGPLRVANDLQVVGDRIYVTRFDQWAWLPWRSKDWQGIAEVQDGRIVNLREQEFPGANGIVDLGEGADLVVADYWNSRLRFIKKDGDGEGGDRFATAELPIRPDNLTIVDDRILITGQRSAFLAGLNFFLPFLPSPSAVIEIKKGDLNDQAKGVMLWWGGLFDGRSVSVAVPDSKDLILGQIQAPDLLHVTCNPNE